MCKYTLAFPCFLRVGEELARKREGMGEELAENVPKASLIKLHNFNIDALIERTEIYPKIAIGFWFCGDSSLRRRIFSIKAWRNPVHLLEFLGKLIGGIVVKLLGKCGDRKTCGDEQGRNLF